MLVYQMVINQVMSQLSACRGTRLVRGVDNLLTLTGSAVDSTMKSYVSWCEWE